MKRIGIIGSGTMKKKTEINENKQWWCYHWIGFTPNGSRVYIPQWTLFRNIKKRPPAVSAEREKETKDKRQR